MIRRMISFVKLELTGMWKRPLPLAMLLLLGLLSIGLLAGGVQVSAGSTDVGGEKLAINAGFNLAFFDVVVSAIVVPFFAAVICGMPLLVDGDRKIQPLLLSTPLRHFEYAAGRFAGALAMLLMVIAGWQPLSRGRSTRAAPSAPVFRSSTIWPRCCCLPCRWRSLPVASRWRPVCSRGSRWPCSPCRW